MVKHEKEDFQVSLKGSSSTTYFQAVPDSDDLLMPNPDQILESEDWRIGGVLIVEVACGGLMLRNKSKLVLDQASVQGKQP